MDSLNFLFCFVLLLFLIIYNIFNTIVISLICLVFHFQFVTRSRTLKILLAVIFRVMRIVCLLKVNNACADLVGFEEFLIPKK